MRERARQLLHPDRLQLAASVSGLAIGGLLRLLGSATGAGAVWGTVALIALLPSVVSVFRELRRRRWGVDIVATLALLGSLIVGEYLAGAVIALMLATGRALEARASTRAKRELTALLERAPTSVHRVQGDSVVSVDLDEVRRGDVLLIASGEVVPVDGTVTSQAVLDESALTGEAAPVNRSPGDPIRSGGVNAGGPFHLRATAVAAESTYAGVLRLVREAEQGRAPMLRLADSFALWFVPITIGIAVLAAVVARDPVRAVAVLVVATPCPLILAAPVALVGGLSRAAHRGVIVKNGGALETLGRADIVLFDKTGTLTEGRARLADIETDGRTDPDEVLRLAASLDQVSAHALAIPIVRAARERRLVLELPREVVEDPGSGVRGIVAGRRVAVGRVGFVAGSGNAPTWTERLRRRTAYEGLANVFVSIDGLVVGALVLEDPLRADAGRALQRLRAAGIKRIVMVTGDHPDVAQSVAAAIGIDAVYAECSPADKVGIVRSETSNGTVLMVGDGINDAPALAAAAVGVAMGVRGATAASETADVVLMVDRIDRLADTLLLARRTRQIARQSIAAGMALSFVAMGVAAFGFLTPVAGALVQEAIDVAVILNALRAHAGIRERRPSDIAIAAGRRVLEEHTALRRGTAQLRSVADELGLIPPASAHAHLLEVRRFLDDDLLPHEHAEERDLYPAVAPYVGGDETVVAARRQHTEVAHLARVLGGMIDDIDPAGPGEDVLPGLRRVLYGLHAVLILHRAEEEERLSRVVDEPEVASRRAAG
jgi:heavy metal translocating P-type ATPase